MDGWRGVGWDGQGYGSCWLVVTITTTTTTTTTTYYYYYSCYVSGYGHHHRLTPGEM